MSIMPHRRLRRHRRLLHFATFPDGPGVPKLHPLVPGVNRRM